MTSNQLKESLSKQYGLESRWPKQLAVDSDTFACVCRDILLHKYNGAADYVRIAIGSAGGIMFAGVEILLDEVM